MKSKCIICGQDWGNVYVFRGDGPFHPTCMYDEWQKEKSKNIVTVKELTWFEQRLLNVVNYKEKK